MRMQHFITPFHTRSTFLTPRYAAAMRFVYITPFWLPPLLFHAIAFALRAIHYDDGVSPFTS